MSKDAFLIDGTKVFIHEKTKTSILVSRYYFAQNYFEEEEYEELSDEKIIVDKVYKKPPTEVFDEKIESLKSIIKDYRKTKSTEHAEFLEKRKEYEIQLNKFNRIPELKNILDYIDKKFTHVVYLGYEWKKGVVTMSAALKEQDSYNGYRLLSLFGNTKGDLEWRINRYSDGSGSDCTVSLCMSLEEGKEIIIKYLLKKIDTFLNDCKRPDSRADWPYPIEDEINYLIKNNIDVDPKAIKLSKEKALATAKKNLKYKMDEFKRSQKSLDELEDKVKQLSGEA